MKNMMAIMFALPMLIAATCSKAAFTNLDFESYSGSGNDLLPGWERSVGDYMWPLIDQYPTSTAGLGLVTVAGQSGEVAISGSYSLFLCPGIGATFPYDPPTVSIWQTDLVPASAGTISFTIDSLGAASYAFNLGAHNLLVNAPSVLPDGNLRYTTDISALAGQVATLSFSASANDAVWNRIDDIQFTAIPEPSTLALCLVGIAGLLSNKSPNKRLQSASTKCRVHRTLTLCMR
jgi:hypothetical protein